MNALTINEKLKVADYNGTTYTITGKTIGGWNLQGKKKGEYTVIENIKTGTIFFIYPRGNKSEVIDNVKYI